MPASVTKIEYIAFSWCENLTSINIPDGITTIGESAFIRCVKLSNITIPVSVTKIESSAFCDCISLADVYYKGTESQWNAININSSSNEALTRATIHYTEPTATPSPTPSPTPTPTATPTATPTVPTHTSAPKCFIITGSNVTNLFDTKQITAIIIAEYDGGKLKNIKVSEEIFTAGETKTFNIPPNGRIFVWDSLNSMKPLTK